MAKDEEDEFALETLTNILAMASHDSLVETLIRVSSELGIEKIDGVQIGEFYERKKRKIAEELLCDHADTNVELSSKMKRIWDKLDEQDKK